MKIDIARQPLIPAFLTLAVLVAVAMWNVDLANNIPVPQPASATDGSLAITLPQVWIATFQEAHPGWSKWIAALLLLLAGTAIGKTSVRYNLYSVGTCLAIPLFGCLVNNFVIGDHFLTATLITTLLILSFKNFCRSFCNGFGFDALFRASLYLGVLLLIEPAAIPLLLLLPLTLILFRRTLREATVAVVSFLLPGLTIAYLNWGAGGDFLAPFILSARTFVDGAPLQLLSALSLQQLAVLGGIIALDLLSILFFFTDLYTVGSKARLILILNIGMLVLTVASLCGPAAGQGTLAMLAAPSAILLPFMMVRTHRPIALLFYLLLLLGATIGTFLQ